MLLYSHRNWQNFQNHHCRTKHTQAIIKKFGKYLNTIFRYHHHRTKNSQAIKKKQVLVSHFPLGSAGLGKIDDNWQGN